MSHSLLCETVTGATMAELVAARDAATTGDLVELRLDGIANLDVAAALNGRQRPTIATCRPVWEGGRFAGDEESRLRVLSEALERGAECVDVEWRAIGNASQHPGFEALMREGGSRVIVSSHDFDGMPGDLAERAKAMRDRGARIIKIAATPTRLVDTLTLRDITRESEAVVIGMGETGLSTRLLATRFGSKWTYGGNAVAPGQIPPGRMLRDYRFKSIDDATLLYGVVGENAARALAPVLHNAAFAAAGLNAVCVPLQTSDFLDFLRFADALNFSGAILTGALEHDAVDMSVQVDELTKTARKANVVRRSGSTWESNHIGIAGAGEDSGTVSPEALARQVSCAEQQFEWWTSQRPVSGVMRAAAELALASNHTS